VPIVIAANSIAIRTADILNPRRVIEARCTAGPAGQTRSVPEWIDSGSRCAHYKCAFASRRDTPGDPGCGLSPVNVTRRRAFTRGKTGRGSRMKCSPNGKPGRARSYRRRAAAVGFAGRIAAVALTAVLASCGGGGGSSSSPATPTAPPAAAPLPTSAQAFAFLDEATFGPTPAEVQRVTAAGYSAWIDEQIALPPTFHLPVVQQLFVTNPPPAGTPQAQVDRMDAWFRAALNGPDQLRQRVAYALSQILVASDVGALRTQPQALAFYYDALVRNALGNYRDLLKDVTLTPAMGIYLSMLGNQKPDAARNIRPDENYAREVMQLFTIGLVQLNADGTPKLDAQGIGIPTYDQSVIEGFANAFTGWTYAGATQATFANPRRNFVAPMAAVPFYHSAGTKKLLDGVTVPAGQTPEQDLDAAIDSLFRHPNVGPFVGRQLIQRLVTANPSPQYVERVARVFADNGRGVRGDLAAVVRAILLDPEARAAPGDASGRLEEPFLRFVQLWRAYGAKAASGRYLYAAPEQAFGQAPLRSPSVFNFYRPDHQPPGELQSANLASPEMQITTETTTVTAANALYVTVFNRNSSAANPQPNDVLIDVTEELALADAPASLVDRVAQKLLGGQISAALRQAAIDQVGRVPATNRANRVAEALYLVVTSPEYAVSR
jgi:uncharacterized protein (DUF1800 family)